MKSFLTLTISILTIGLHQTFGTCSLPIPTGLKLKNQTSCSVDVSWKKVSGADHYIVEYRISGNNTWTFSANISSTATTISGLASSTSYDFAVASYCSDNTTVGFSSSLSKTTQSCSAPAALTAYSSSTSTATISWTPLCGSSSFILQYRKQGLTSWTKVSNIATTSYTITGLVGATTYEYRVQTNCGASKSSWSSTLTITTLATNPPKRNMLLFVLDDARYDEVQPNGAPSWFVTPGFTKIANEGVNFKLTIPTTSQCAPSRACMYTGVYPHVNGVEKNGDTLSSAFPLVQQILKDDGYYTGFVGKYGQYLGDPKGFNWWATSDGDVYIDPPYRINGKDTTISGHISDVYPALAKTFLNSVPAGRNWVLFFFTRVPHMPTIPRAQDSTLYTNQAMPFPNNFPFYTNNYPSFYLDEEWNFDSTEAVGYKLDRFQTLKGASDNMDSLLKWIQAKEGTLDSTFILFTSDNGYLLGEHHLHEKVLALEESWRVPLFIRFPKWFSSNTVISNQFASNVDFATTLLDLVGLPNSYNFQGLSLRQLANGQAQRDKFFYESGWDPYIAKLRAVRTLNDVYIRSYCKTTTEEYYDLVTDPKNNTNQIFNSGYQSTISARRTTLDSLRTFYADNETLKNKTCNLVTNGQRMTIFADDETPAIDFVVGPNPSSSSVNFYFTSHDKSPALVSVYDELNHLMWQQRYDHPVDVSDEIDCSQWSCGFYYVKVQQNNLVWGRKMIVQH